MTSNVKLTIPPNVKELTQGIKPTDQIRALRKVTVIAIGDNSHYAPIISNNNKFPYWKRGTGLQTSRNHNLNNSQRMDTQWDYSLSGLDRAEIVNKATYSGVVIGHKQANFHRLRGWPNVPEYAEKQETADRLGQIHADELFKGVL